MKVTMKVTRMVPETIEVSHVIINVPVRYEEEDIPNDFPMRDGESWNAKVQIDTGQIEGWPKGRAGKMHMKVCDAGVYKLLEDGTNFVVAEIDQDYVPNGLIPGEYGDYIILDIDENGRITNWPRKPSLKAFFKPDEDQD